MSKLKSKKLWAGVVITLGVGAAVAFATSKSHHDNKEDEDKKGPARLEFAATDLAQVQMRSLDRIIQVSGTLKPTTHAVLRSKIGAVVNEVLVREGERVSKGQILARFDSSSYQAHLHEQEGNREVARAQLALDTRTHDKNAALLKQGFISGTTFDASASSVEMSRARLKAAEAQVEVAGIAMNDTVLRAPISGLIGKRSIQPGEKVEVNSELLSIVDLNEMELQVAVPTTDIASVSAGQTAEFKVDGMGERSFTGTVKRINPEAEEGSRSIMVFMSVKNQEGVLRGGMFAKGRLALAKRAPQLTIPASAVLDGNGQPYVYWIDQNKVMRANITVGANDERSGLVEVSAGLKDGATIVATRLAAVKPGSIAVMKGAETKTK